MAAKKKAKKKRRTASEALAAQREAAAKRAPARKYADLTPEERAFIEGAPRGGRKKAKKAAAKKQPNRTRNAQLATRVHEDTLLALRKTCAIRRGKRLQPWRIGDVIEAAVLDWLARHPTRKPSKKQ